MRHIINIILIIKLSEQYEPEKLCEYIEKCRENGHRFPITVFGCKMMKSISQLTTILSNISQIEEIKFHQYNEIIPAGLLPSGLKSLTLGYPYNQPIDKNVLPSGLESMVLCNFNHPIIPGV
jgi:hypothetical protein